MSKHALTILRCEHRKIFKICLTNLHNMHERLSHMLVVELRNISRVFCPDFRFKLN